MRDVLTSTALGLCLALLGGCPEDPVPTPVAAPESAASSGEPCPAVEWRCCTVTSRPPDCANGFNTCAPGEETCELGEDAGP